jgi:hypothetical protein
VPIHNSFDRIGRQRFSQLKTIDFVMKRLPKWYQRQIIVNKMNTIDHISNEFIGFHYLTADDMRLIDIYLYKMNPYRSDN